MAGLMDGADMPNMLSLSPQKSSSNNSSNAKDSRTTDLEALPEMDSLQESTYEEQENITNTIQRQAIHSKMLEITEDARPDRQILGLVEEIL